jgi:hypothetical protein
MPQKRSRLLRTVPTDEAAMLVAMWRMSEAPPHAIGGGCYHFCYPTAWGRDAFLAAGRPPMVAVCDQRYVFNPVVNDNDLNPSAACPPALIRRLLRTLYSRARHCNTTRPVGHGLSKR